MLLRSTIGTRRTIKKLDKNYVHAPEKQVTITNKKKKPVSSMIYKNHKKELLRKKKSKIVPIIEENISEDFLRNASYYSSYGCIEGDDERDIYDKDDEEQEIDYP